jgi:hypothetical protein
MIKALYANLEDKMYMIVLDDRFSCPPDEKAMKILESAKQGLTLVMCSPPDESTKAGTIDLKFGGNRQ